MLVFDFMLSRIFCRDDDMPGEGSAVAGAPVALRRGDPRSQGPFRDRSKVSGWHEPNWLRRAHQNEGSLREAPVNLINRNEQKGKPVAMARLVSSTPGEGGMLLRTWISHTVPHMTISITTESFPGIPNWLVATAIGAASIFVLGTALKGCAAELTRAQHRYLASCSERDEGEWLVHPSQCGSLVGPQECRRRPTPPSKRACAPYLRCMACLLAETY